MKTLRSIWVLGLSLLMLSACNSDLDTIAYNADNAKPAVLQQGEAAYVLDRQKGDETAITFQWEKPDMGYAASVTTSLEMDVKGKGFSGKVVLASTKTDKSYAISTADLNSRIAGLLRNYEMEVAATDLEFRLSSSISEATEVVYSNVWSANITPYDTDREYPKVWVVGDYCGWGWTNPNSQFLFSFAEDENYEGVVDFGEKAAGGFKITGVAGWEDASNWGTDGAASAPEAEAASIQLIAASSSKDLKCYAKRFYHLKLNTTTLLLTKAYGFDQLGVIGDAAGGWGVNDDIAMKFNTSKQRFFVDIELTKGNMKFRADNKWDTQWGGKDGVLTAGGGDIPVEAGKYRIYVNLNDAGGMTYELNEKDFGK